MKLTNQKLKRIIKEEIAKALKEDAWSDLDKALKGAPPDEGKPESKPKPKPKYNCRALPPIDEKEPWPVAYAMVDAALVEAAKCGTAETCGKDIRCKQRVMFCRMDAMRKHCISETSMKDRFWKFTNGVQIPKKA
jgi:hypothetical protein